MTTGSRKTTDLLTGRKAKARRGERLIASEIGANPLVRDYELGPFPHLPVATFPPELVEILKRRTGRRFPAELLADYERIRAFLGYQGFELTAALEASRRLADGIDRGEGVNPGLPVRAQHLAARTSIKTPELGGQGMPDPSDLGDD